MHPALKLVLTLTAMLVAAVGGWYLAQELRSPEQPATEAPDGTGAPGVAGIVLPDMQGEPRDLAEWDGRVRLVNFWATWCPPCRKEIPVLIDLQDRYGEQGLTVIGISMDTDHDALARYVADKGIDYPILVGEQAAIDAAEAMGADFVGLPFTVLVGRDGQVVSVHLGEMDAEEAERFVAGQF